MSRGVIVLFMAVGMFWRWVGRCSGDDPGCGGGVVSGLMGVAGGRRRGLLVGVLSPWAQSYTHVTVCV